MLLSTPVCTKKHVSQKHAKEYRNIPLSPGFTFCFSFLFFSKKTDKQLERDLRGAKSLAMPSSGGSDCRATIQSADRGASMSHNGRRIRIPTGSLIGAQACSPVKPFVKPSPSNTAAGGLIDAAAVAKKVCENFVPRKFPAILIILRFWVACLGLGQDRITCSKDGDSDT